MSSNLKKSLLRAIAIASARQEVQEIQADDEQPQPAGEDWMRAMMRMYLLSQNA